MHRSTPTDQAPDGEEGGQARRHFAEGGAWAKDCQSFNLFRLIASKRPTTAPKQLAMAAQLLAGAAVDNLFADVWKESRP